MTPAHATVSDNAMRVSTVFLVGAIGVGACAKANSGTATGDAGGSGSGSGTVDASCGDHCDADGDGVIDGHDLCPDTATGAIVNTEGCADAQLPSTLRDFPPFGLTWTSSGTLGRAGAERW